ncbi:hypothetical protein NQ318_013298 [Aromia moschata]|uniref:Uncharacterized protein n=1 Tax=Aromia moschata TaxID=1265417 RepID=A0AAV8Y031_9CUCU|nr:hypothetical protein NQ318_013298 [Aromia moschata]
MTNTALVEPSVDECSSLYRAMQQQAFYIISRKYVHDVQLGTTSLLYEKLNCKMKLAMPMHDHAFRFSVAHAHYEKLATGTYGGPDACFPPYLWRLPFFYLDVLCPSF